MAYNIHWSADDLKKKGLIQVDGVYVPARGQVSKRVEKLPSLIERAGIYQQQIEGYNRKIKSEIAKTPPKNVGGKMKAAIKTEVDGIQFDSRLEAYLYTLLRGSGLVFEMQKEYLLQQGFKYNGDAVRPVKIVVDFFIQSKNILIDSKGFQFRDGVIKYKMLKWYFYQLTDYPPAIEMPKNKQECDILLNKLLYEL